jgi:hypothetical protein
MSIIIYTQENGNAAVVYPVDPSIPIEELASGAVPQGTDYTILDSLPDGFDNTFFDAYEHKDGTLVVNIDKAKEIRLNQFREVRKPLLDALDTQYIRALERGDSVLQGSIAAQKQALRDVTKGTLPDNLASIKEHSPSILYPASTN